MKCTYKHYDFIIHIHRLESSCKDIENTITRVLDFMIENGGKFGFYELNHTDKHITVLMHK